MQHRTHKVTGACSSPHARSGQECLFPNPTSIDEAETMITQQRARCKSGVSFAGWFTRVLTTCAIICSDGYGCKERLETFHLLNGSVEAQLTVLWS